MAIQLEWSDTPPPAAAGDTPPNNEHLGMDPAYENTTGWDPDSGLPSTYFNPTGNPGDDIVTTLLLMLDAISSDPFNTTDAQIFLLFCAALVQTGAIFYTLTMPDGSQESLDEFIGNITVTKADGTQESLVACAVDIAFEEKYAEEVAAGNTDWTPWETDENGENFYQYITGLFSGPNAENSLVAQEAIAEANMQTFGNTEGGGRNPGDEPLFYTYEGESADEVRLNAAEEWDYDVEHSNITEQESEMRVGAVNTAGEQAGLMASLMLLYRLLEEMGYSDLYLLTDQVNWYQDRTDDLTEMSSDWEDGFDSAEEAYDFVGDVEDFVDEVNSNPQYADSSLMTTVNSSLGEDGFLGMDTPYYYKDENGNWQQATVGDLYDHGNIPVDNGNGQIFYLKLDDGNYTYGVDMNDPAYIDAHGAGTTYNGQVYDSNGQPVTYGWCYENQDEPVYDNTGKQITTSDGSPATGEDVLEHHWPDNDVTDGDFLYYTFNTWSLDPSGQVAPAPQYGQVQSDFREADTGFTDAAGTSTTLENQTSNWIQEIESAMSKAISTYIDAITTLINNQTVQ